MPGTVVLPLMLACWYLQIAGCVGTSYDTGPFTITYDPASFPAVTVLRAGTVLWTTTTSDNGYLEAVLVQQNVSQNGGIFVVKSRAVKTCVDANITSTRSDYDTTTKDAYPRVTFVGLLCGEEPFEMWFAAIDASDGNETATHLQFGASLTSPSTVYNQLVLTYPCEKDEHFYGFGNQYTQLDMKGQRLPVFLMEQGVGRGLQPLTLILDLEVPGAGKLLLPRSHSLTHVCKHACVFS